MDGDLRNFYERLRERSKPGELVVIAVTRKLLMQLNTVERRGTTWVNQHVNNGLPLQAAPA